ncbi:MAG: hypothetical protein JWM09_235 [Francisellaceae bacterium]|nr:hypothetical protein [Francisellaceae bacterium]
MNRTNELDEHKDFESDMASDAFQQAQNDQIKGLANMMADLKAEFAILQTQNIEIKQENKNLKKKQEKVEKNKINAEILAEQLQAQARQLEEQNKLLKAHAKQLEEQTKEEKQRTDTILRDQKNETEKLKFKLELLLENPTKKDEDKKILEGHIRAGH